MKRLLVALMLASTAAAVPAAAQWTQAQISEFTRECVQGCQQNPNVHETRKAECPTFCSCFTEEAQRRFSSAEYDTMNADAKTGRETDAIRQFRTIAPICNQRVFGR
jgi:hypothetical protein